MRCNVPNGWCPLYDLDEGDCSSTDADLYSWFVKDCPHRKLVNRFKRTFIKIRAGYNFPDSLYWQWLREEEKVSNG